MPFAAYPLPPPDPALDVVAQVLDPVLAPLGFAAGQIGSSDRRAQVIFCRGLAHSQDDACVDLVVDLEATPDWHVTDVRYWGFPSDRWHLPFAGTGGLTSQVAELARTLPAQLATP